MGHLKFYKSSFIAYAIAILMGFGVGYHSGSSVSVGLSYAFGVAILAILEVCLSFDNAVVNAQELEKLNEKDKKWFMTWGMIVAVFGMRLIIPIILVSLFSAISPIEAINLALYHPEQYANVLSHSNVYISMFGAGFLGMLATSFFRESDNHWIFVEKHKNLVTYALPFISGLIVIAAIIFEDMFKHPLNVLVVVASYFVGILGNVALNKFKDYMEAHESVIGQHAANAAKLSIASLAYLEVLDASMSFDGVVGAFSISHNIFVIMLGLGVGAMFVRSMTVHLVETGVMSEIEYLENGAMWAIYSLSGLMVANAFFHIPDVVTAGTSLIIIVAAIVTSLRKKEG